VNWTAVWIAWLVITLGTFGVLEYIGLKREGTGGTLSYLVWRVLFRDADVRLDGKFPRQPRGVVFFVVLAPLLWLILHFALGGRVG
jgi:hypothetical protein